MHWKRDNVSNNIVEGSRDETPHILYCIWLYGNITFVDTIKYMLNVSKSEWSIKSIGIMKTLFILIIDLLTNPDVKVSQRPF